MEIKINRLEKSYGSHQILKGVNLNIAEGQFASLLGPYGSGKTTILRCFVGLELPDSTSGEIHLGNEVLSGPKTWVHPEKRNLGMVFQNYAVWPHMTVRENVAFPLKIRSLPSSQIQKKVDEVLEIVRLHSVAERYTHQISGGQQQRVALARALVMSPRALLLDEPLSNLDALLREELGAEIRRLQQSLKLTTILVTHDRNEALSLSDQIFLLNRGEIDAQGTPEELYQNPPTPFAAEFLSDGLKINDLNGKSHIFIPRRWKTETTSGAFGSFEILSRIYLGNEYEYWAKSEKLSAPIRFFDSRRRENGEKLLLQYPA